MSPKENTQTAGPFVRFSTRKLIPALSNWSAGGLSRCLPVTLPQRPSSASISLTMIPFPIPPMDGLQEHSPILLRSWVTRTVFAPDRAAAALASEPACPPPMTQTSKMRVGCISDSVANLRRRMAHCTRAVPRTTQKDGRCSINNSHENPAATFVFFGKRPEIVSVPGYTYFQPMKSHLNHRHLPSPSPPVPSSPP